MSSVRGPRWSEINALFGGRFDPPHLGHQEAVRGLLKIPAVREVWVLPSPTPPHKAAVAPILDRIEMARRCFLTPTPGVDTNRIRLDLREVEAALLRPGQPTYTFDTLQKLQGELREVSFVIGTDQLEELHLWHRFPDVLGLSHWIVLARKPDGQDRARRVLQKWEASGLAQMVSQDLWALKKVGTTFLTLVPTEAPEVSSTRIRETLARTGRPPEKNLSPEVWQYLMERRLYGSVGLEK